MKRSRITIIIVLTIALCLSSLTGLAKADPAYQDEFTESTLMPFWTFVNDLGTSSYSLTAHDDWLRITSPTGNGLSQTSNFNAPRVLQSVSGDFTATTCVSGSFTQAGFRAGLLVWKDINNYFRVEKYGSNQVLMYGYIAGTETYTSMSAPGLQYLKIVKTGTGIEGFWSQDGSSWNSVHQYNLNVADPFEVGLFVINVGSVPFSADFDYFMVVPAFVLPEYPLGVCIPLLMVGAFVFYKVIKQKRAMPSLHLR